MPPMGDFAPHLRASFISYTIKTITNGKSKSQKRDRKKEKRDNSNDARVIRERRKKDIYQGGSGEGESNWWCIWYCWVGVFDLSHTLLSLTPMFIPVILSFPYLPNYLEIWNKKVTHGSGIWRSKQRNKKYFEIREKISLNGEKNKKLTF